MEVECFVRAKAHVFVIGHFVLNGRRWLRFLTSKIFLLVLSLLLCRCCFPPPPSQLSGATGVVSCVGAFGSNEQMEKICGDATVTATEAAKKVPKKLANSVAKELPAWSESTGPAQIVVAAVKLKYPPYPPPPLLCRCIQRRLFPFVRW